MQTKDWLLNNLQHDSIFIDVGANVGIHSLTAGRKIGNQGHIFAIEPTSTFKMLKKNLRIKDNNHRAPTTILNIAIGNKSEKREDSIYKIWGASPELGIWTFVTLDDLVQSINLSKIDIIKIDVDGYELEVLEGASQIISEYNPAVIVEINEGLATREASPDQIFDYFLNLRYTDVLLVDDHNYIFTNNWEIGDSWPNYLRLSRWRKNNYTKIHKGEKFEPNISIKPANPNIFFNKDYLLCSGHLAKWNYILEISEKTMHVNLPIFIEIIGTLKKGKISAAILSNDNQTLISNEDKITTLGKFKLEIASENWENKAVIRNFDNGYFDFQIDKIHFFHGITASEKKLEPSFDKIEKIKEKSLLFQKLNLPLFHTQNRSVELQKHQGWLMEQSSNHLLIQLVKGIKNAKILEIGTWEGFTAATLIKNTDAEIWSIDINQILDGSEYTSRYQELQGSQVKEVGWLYKKLDYLGRVHQIFADSTQYNWDVFPNSFFDLIFIDGDHEESSVKADTFNTISKIKKGGIMIWDDFNFEDEGVTLAERGVNDFISNNLIVLNSHFELYFMQGTQFLIGKKL